MKINKNGKEINITAENMMSHMDTLREFIDDYLSDINDIMKGSYFELQHIYQNQFQIYKNIQGIPKIIYMTFNEMEEQMKLKDKEEFLHSKLYLAKQ